MTSYRLGRAPKVIDEATRPVLEPLESRTLLSVSVGNGTLNIVGTDAADSIRVRVAKDHSLLQVKINGQVNLVHKADVTAINIDAGAGDDIVMISESGGPLQIPATILGGNGNDVIQGGGGNDLIQGGDGNDSLFGASGDDVVQADAGNDTIVASTGKDSIDGGDGYDLVLGNGETNDSIITSAGNDKVSEGARPNFPIQTFTDVPVGYSVRQQRAGYGFGDMEDKGFTTRGQ